MGYKLLGFLVWRAGRWYVRRRMIGGAGRRLAIGALVALAVGGAVAAGRAGGAGGGDNLV